MTKVEFVADRIRREWFHHRHLAACLDWRHLQPAEQRQWLHLARVALDADSAWRPPDGHGPPVRAVA